MSIDHANGHPPPCPCAPERVWLLSRGHDWTEVASPLPPSSPQDWGVLAQEAGYQPVAEWDTPGQQMNLTLYAPADGGAWMFVWCLLGGGCQVVLAQDPPSVARLLGDLLPATAAGLVLDAAEADAEARRRTPEPPAPPRPPRPRAPRGWRRQ
jgi:hypothetical protein